MDREISKAQQQKERHRPILTMNLRRGEIDLRMAVGAIRPGIRLLMIGKGLILLTLAALPALVVCLNIAYADLLTTEVMPVTWIRLLVDTVVVWRLSSCWLAGIHRNAARAWCLPRRCGMNNDCFLLKRFAYVAGFSEHCIRLQNAQANR